jgi:DNA-binding CsgD family transcriptional regulator
MEAAGRYSVRTIPVGDIAGAVRGLWLVEPAGQQMSLDWLDPGWTFSQTFSAVVRCAAEGVTRSSAASCKGAFAGQQPWTQREGQVLRLIAWGHPLKTIARELGISIKTVEFHRTAAMKKAQLTTRTDLVRLAARLNWFAAPIQLR